MVPSHPVSRLSSRTSFYEAGCRLALVSGSSGLAIFRMMHLFLVDLRLWCWPVPSVFSKLFACCATKQTRQKRAQEGRRGVSRAVLGRFHITDLHGSMWRLRDETKGPWLSECCELHQRPGQRRFWSQSSLRVNFAVLLWDSNTLS